MTSRSKSRSGLFASGDHDGAFDQRSSGDREGAATLTLEILQEQPDLDAMVVSVGGGPRQWAR